jgi:4-carboxymuconolactone decarboxylase
MDERERHAAGTAIRRKVLGDAHVDRASARATPLTAEFQDLLTRFAWGEIWTRPAFDIRTRRILTIGTLVALGRVEELRLHMRAALHEAEGRLSIDEIKEILLQQAAYCGIPAANTAFEILRQLADEPAS